MQATLIALSRILTKKIGNAVSKKAHVINEIHDLCNLFGVIDIGAILTQKQSDSIGEINLFRYINCRLDFFLISNDLNKVVRSCCILNTPESDHSVITLRLKSQSL